MGEFIQYYLGLKGSEMYLERLENTICVRALSDEVAKFSISLFIKSATQFPHLTHYARRVHTSNCDIEIVEVIDPEN